MSNAYACLHTRRICALWQTYHCAVGEGATSLLLLAHDESGGGGLTVTATITPGKFVLRAKEDPLAGNTTEIEIALDAVPTATYVRVVAFQFGQRQYARKERHPDIEQPAGTKQYFAFLAEPKEIV